MAIVVGGVAVDLEASSARYVAEMDKAARATLAATQRMQGTMSRWTHGFNTAERSVNSSLSRIGGGLRSLQGLIATFGVGLGAREIIRYADAWRAAEAQLTLVSASATEATAVHERLFGIAQNLGVGIEGLTTIYVRAARNAESLGASQDDLLQVTEALGAAIRISGTSAIEAQNALIQLSQSFASGALRGDELRSISEQMPVVLDAIAAATGRTRQEVINYARENGLAADLVIESLQRQRDAWVLQAETVGGSVDQALTRVQNAIQRVVGQAGQAGAFQPLVDSLNNFASTLESGRVTSALASFAAGVVEAADLILKEFADIAAIVSAVFEGRFSDALAVVQGRLARFGDAATAVLRGDYETAVNSAINRTEALGAAIDEVDVNSLYPPAATAAASSRLATAPPKPLLELRAAPVPGIASPQPALASQGSLPGGLRLPTITPIERPRVESPFQIQDWQAPAPFDPRFKFQRPEQPEMFGPPALSQNEMAEVARGQELIAQKEQLLTLYGQINSAAQTFSETVAQGLTRAITGASTFGEALRSMAEALMQAVIQAVILQTVTASLGAAGGGGALGMLFPAPRALGGPVAAGRPYLVGERGPELFSPTRAGQIIPNSKLSGGGDGGTVINNVIHADQIDPGTVSRVLNIAYKQVPGAMANAQARGRTRSRTAF